MAKRVIAVALVLVLALFAYVGYHSYDAKRAGANGEVYSNGAVRRVQPDVNDQNNEPEKIVYPAGTIASQDRSTAQTAQAPAPQGATTELSDGNAQQTAQSQAQQTTQNQQPVGANAPATDSISPNPPNGMTFSGTGRFQLYRQGNLTWRLDTDTGRTCVIFATDEEWRKPKVYRAGCGKS